MLLYDFKEEEWIVYSGGIAPEKAVVDLRFKENGDIVLIYGNGNEKTVANNTMLEKVNEMEQTIANLQETVNNLLSVIEIQNQ